MRTSKEWKVPPRQILYGKPKAWNKVDTKLSMALVILEQETCRDCGTVSWLGHSADNRIVFKHDVTHCYGCAELERVRDEGTKSKAKDYGSKPYVKAAGDLGMSLPDRAEEYSRRASRAQREAEREAGRNKE